MDGWRRGLPGYLDVLQTPARWRVVKSATAVRRWRAGWEPRVALADLGAVLRRMLFFQELLATLAPA
ncbi:hypothetical protein [Nonomuraea sp. JJY05]|uniref:hypothetical protein n=1 Tax=Nonomuraea sp. JJY05 TaxID=3350255 RepID=UPI00373E3901